jgi:hypothetical protein
MSEAATPKILGNITNFVKTLAKNAPAIALTAAVVPDIMDFMKGLTEPFYQTGEALEELGLTASEGFEEMASDIADSIYNLQPAAEGLSSWISDTYNTIEEKDWSGLSTNIETGLTTAWSGLVDFFADDQRMEDIGSGAAAIVNGVAGFMNNVTQEDWNNIFEGIGIGLKAFINGLDFEDIFGGLANLIYTLGWSIMKNLIEGIEDWINEQTEGDWGLLEDFELGPMP